MSGICGTVGTDGRSWDEADIDGILRALAPLGRDGGGTWAGTAGRCGAAVGAALRQGTPEDAADRQPAQSDDGSLVLVADVRLDNRAELAPALGLRDERAVPDSAFALRAYERWGEAALDRILGEFALAVVDRRRGGVLLARDHVGARPLAIHRRRGVVAFASTALALTGFEGVGHALDTRHAAEVLALLFDSGRTFVEGVRSVPPATALWIDASGVREWSWWKPDPHAIVDLGSAEAHERELRDAFDRAVEARLRSSGAVGAMTSGGLDSTSVTATAARSLAPGRLRTYTAAPPPGWRGDTRANWDADEAPLVRRLAEMHPNIDPSFVQVEPGTGLFDSHEPLWELGGGPGLNPCNLLWVHAIWARSAADGVTTLLTGSQGNNFFSADGPHWLSALLSQGRVATALREVTAWARASGDGPLRLARLAIFPLMPVPVRRLGQAAPGRASALEDWIASTALRPELYDEIDLRAARPLLDRRRRVDTRELALSLVRNAAGQAELGAAVAAHTGVEERDPTLDRRVIEAGMRQPEWVRRHDGVTRAVVRGAMRDRLPAAIVQRTRRGDQLPDWLDVLTAARSELADELEAARSHATSRELIDTDRLDALMRRWPDRARCADPTVVRDYRYALLRALYVSRYLRWFEGRAAAAPAARLGSADAGA